MNAWSAVTPLPERTADQLRALLRASSSIPSRRDFSPAVSPRPRGRRSSFDRRYIVGYAPNGLHLPLRIVHGGKDGPGRSKVVADAYDQLGYPHVFDVQDDLDHNVWDYAYQNGRMIAWLKQQERPRVPRRVRLTSAEARYDRAYWLRIVAPGDGPGFAELDGDRNAEPAGRADLLWGRPGLFDDFEVGSVTMPSSLRTR